MVQHGSNPTTCTFHGEVDTSCICHVTSPAMWPTTGTKEDIDPSCTQQCFSLDPFFQLYPTMIRLHPCNNDLL